MSRLFTAVSLPASVRDRLNGLPDDLTGARFLEYDDFHLTLRFFGDVDRHVARELVDGLAAIEQRPFELTINGLDVFGGDRPRAVIATLAPAPSLEHLQRAHERVARSAGREPERRKYTPHITVARLNGTYPQAVADYLARVGQIRCGPFGVASFDLMSSRPGTGGPPYRIEDTFWFGGEPVDERLTTGDWQD